MSQHAVIFDLDGTLTDPGPGIIACFRYAFERLARPCPGDHVLTSFIGPPLRATFATLLETSDTGLVEEAVARYRERYERSGIYETRVYDGVHAMLERVERTSAALFVATSKPAVYAERIVKHCGLARRFCGVYGSELDGRFDDKAELLEHLLTTVGVGAGVATMVGDRAADILAAKANGVRSIGALWGYGSQSELRDAGAEKLCPTPKDLASCLVSDLTHMQLTAAAVTPPAEHAARRLAGAADAAAADAGVRRCRPRR